MPGIYSFEDARLQTKGYSYPEWKGFNLHKDAVDYMKGAITSRTTVTPKVVKPQWREPPAPTEAQLKAIAAEKEAKELSDLRTELESAKKAVAEAEVLMVKQKQRLEAAKAKARYMVYDLDKRYTRPIDTKLYYVRGDTVYDDFFEYDLTEPEEDEFNCRSWEAVKAAVYLNGFDSIKEKITEELRYINEQGQTIYQVYADGACADNGMPFARGGVGVYFGKNNKNNFSGPLESYGEQHSNQKAELAAVLQAYDIIHDLKEDRLYEIYTDSKYVISCLTEWCYKWEANGWKNDKGCPVENLYLIQDILTIRGAHGCQKVVGLKWVKAHSKCEGNNQADKLAKAATSSKGS